MTIPETGERRLLAPRLLFDELDTDVTACFPAPLADEKSFLKAWNDVRDSRGIFKIDSLARNYLSEIANRSEILPSEYINDELVLGMPAFAAGTNSAAADVAFFTEFDAGDAAPTERCGTLFSIRRIEKAIEEPIEAAQTIIDRARRMNLDQSDEQAWMTAMNGALLLGDTVTAGALWQIRKKTVTHTVTAYPVLRLRHEKKPRAAFLVWHLALDENYHPEPDMFSYPTEKHRNHSWFGEVEKGSRISCLTPCLLGWHVINQSAGIKTTSGRSGEESPHFIVSADDWREFTGHKWAEFIG